MEEKEEIIQNQTVEQLSMDIEEKQDSDVPEFLIENPEIVYHIADFEGPIELLYQLIKDAKINIEDIFISEVTGQYVEIIRNTSKEELDYDYAAEFITMAAELIYLKSDKSLPRVYDGVDEDSEYDERQLLINKIKEYALLKEESEKLKEMETINRFYREPTYTEKDYRIALVNFSLDKLVQAFANVLVKAEVNEKAEIPKSVEREEFSVHDKMLDIQTEIKVRRTMEFSELFENNYTRFAIVTTFLAVLELLKYGVITAEQEETFGKITISAVEGAEDTQISFNEEDDGKY
ncbi:MAG: segregation/condensation protein A [Clostridia bacterium]|nr:segregation/condensation protein A [Clostridia bacterium]